MTDQTDRIVAIIGASDHPGRYAWRAQQLLLQAGYRVLPITRHGRPVGGVDSVRSILDFNGPIDTVTVYVNGMILDTLVEDIIAKGPRRVILNPGSESDNAIEKLMQAEIEVLQACTLVMLNTGQF